MMPQLAHAGRMQWPDLNCAANLQQRKRTARRASPRSLRDRSGSVHIYVVVEKLWLRRIEALVHFSRWLKERDGFLFDHHNGAGARVAAGMGSPPTRRKYPEAAEFNAVSSAQRRVDRAQDRADETLNITLVETRILRGDAVDKFGSDHRVVPPTRL
jgi:hypothetical protein